MIKIPKVIANGVVNLKASNTPSHYFYPNIHFPFNIMNVCMWYVCNSDCYEQTITVFLIFKGLFKLNLNTTTPLKIKTAFGYFTHFVLKKRKCKTFQ